MQAILALEDGTVFHGTSFGAEGTRTGEVVFNTGMTGYPEILTDPSYKGQMVCMTYPLIGNYGITAEDFESRGLFLSAFIVKEVCRRPSNWRSTQSLPDLLKEHDVVGIQGIDTRRLVKHIREAGAMKAVVSTEITDIAELIKVAADSQGLVGQDLVSEVTSSEKYEWAEPSPFAEQKEIKHKVVVYDFGVKYNILRSLVSAGCSVTVVPAYTKAVDVLAMKPDGVTLSNGPGDPEPLTSIVSEIKELIGKVPLFGICLGHQLLSLALGGKIYKMRFGHHGCNQPVMDLTTRKVEITSQNHGFSVNLDSMSSAENIELTHVNLNDRTAEGMRHVSQPVFSVQYHPEAACGPHDAGYLFERFTNLIEKGSW